MPPITLNEETAKQIIAALDLRDLVWIASEKARSNGDDELALQLFKIHGVLTRKANRECSGS